MMDTDRLNEEQLQELIDKKRTELNKPFGEQGLNDFTLRKSQELDVLIVKAQRQKLKNMSNKSTIIA